MVTGLGLTKIENIIKRKDNQLVYSSLFIILSICWWCQKVCTIFLKMFQDYTFIEKPWTNVGILPCLRKNIFRLTQYWPGVYDVEDGMEFCSLEKYVVDHNCSIKVPFKYCLGHEVIRVIHLLHLKVKSSLGFNLWCYEAQYIPQPTCKQIQLGSVPSLFSNRHLVPFRICSISKDSLSDNRF